MIQLLQIAFIILLLPSSGEVKRKFTPLGNILERCYLGDWNYTLRWGNKSFMHSLPDTFNAGGINNPYLWYENNYYILRKINRGQRFSSVLILPLTDSLQARKYDDPIAFNNDLNLLAFIVNEDSIKIVDLNSGKEASININLHCGSSPPAFCIDGASLNGKELYFHWGDTPSSEIKVYQIPKLK
jgi:hypothetical protein